MPAVPKGAKQPADHKTPGSGDQITFESGGETFTSKPILEVLTPGFIRRHRGDGELDFSFTMLELLFEDEPGALDALDELSWTEFKQIVETLNNVMQERAGATPGE